MMDYLKRTRVIRAIVMFIMPVFYCSILNGELLWESFLLVPVVLYILAQADPVKKSSNHFFMLSISGFFLGISILSGLLVLIVLSWLILFYVWVLYRGSDLGASRGKLLLLSSLAWSWPVWVYPELSVYARLIGAYAAEAFYQALGFDVIKVGTQVLVSSVNIDIAESCSGLDTLQTLMLMGTCLLVFRLGKQRVFWAIFPLIPAFALLSHLLRIIINSGVALGFGAELASGQLHDIVGLLCTMGFFSVLWFLVDYFSKSGGVYES